METRNKVYREIGRFVFNFSQLEFLMRHCLAAALDIMDPVFDAVISPYDFALLCRVTPTVLIEKFDLEKNKIDQLFKACSKINDERNKIVHGTWAFREGDEDRVSSRHVSRQTLTDKYYFENVEEIQKAVDEVERLRTRIIELLGFIHRSKV